MRCVIDYRKPPELCLPAVFSPDAIRLSSARRDIEEILADMGYRLQVCTYEDWARLQDFLAEIYEPQMLNNFGGFTLYKALRFGSGALLETGAGKIAGYILEESFRDRYDSSYCQGLVVVPEHRGRKLSVYLERYNFLQAMARGAKIRRATIAPTNLPSLVSSLNHNGTIADGIHPYLDFEQTPRLLISMPLTIEAMAANRLDISKVPAFLKARREGVDYRILDPTDAEALIDLFHLGRFQIAAVLKPGIASEGSALLALSNQCLQVSFDRG
ncbi:MAG: hypothetical protein QNK37_03480 [Acidobacteriota bacterium]|nr:hypothetical protein [Acidobacteriota bacterium]